MQSRSHNKLDALAEELTLRVEIGKAGTIRYYNENNELHRVNGPAVIRPDGDLCWYQNDELHRLDGPAVIWDDGTEFWHINGVPYTEEEFNLHPLVVEYAKSKS